MQFRFYSLQFVNLVLEFGLCFQPQPFGLHLSQFRFGFFDIRNNFRFRAFQSSL